MIPGFILIYLLSKLIILLHDHDDFLRKCSTNSINMFTMLVHQKLSTEKAKVYRHLFTRKRCSAENRT